jgi:maltose alpha-D-glucosyltransferase/alpha-amylase
MPTIPAWAESAVFYEIYPQAFADGDGDGIGDLRGAQARLGHIASLGCDGIWLNPFYQSPMRDAGYDVEDFCRVAPRYGTDADARAFFAAARAKGIRTIVDLVPGHTADTHEWFRRSVAREEPYRDWYIWTDSAWNSGGPEFAGKMLHGTTNRDGNVLVNFFAHQPALNFGFGQPGQPWQLPTTHPNVRKLWDEMKRIQRHWLDQGASGFRIDMAGSITRKDPQSAEARRFWAECRRDVWGDDAFTVAEWSDPTNALDGLGLHSDFLHWVPAYEDLFRKESERHPCPRAQPSGHSWFDRAGRGDLAAFMRVYQDHYRATVGKGLICIPCGNHDLPRIAIGRDARDLEIVHAFLLTMPGVPFIYYGDEIGLRQLPQPPVTEGCYAPRGGSRVSMQWDASANHGFSTAPTERLWAPVDPAADAPTVAAQERDPQSLLNRMRALIALRRSEPALRASAGFDVLHCETNAYPFAFVRTAADGRRCVVVLNPADRPFAIDVGVAPGPGAPTALRALDAEARYAGGTLRLAGSGRSYGVFAL